VKKTINWRDRQTPGLRLKWKCPVGHEEEDDTPLDRNAYCRFCGAIYFWDEVTQRGPLVQLPRVRAQEARL
jgi:hypothetical protein